MAPECSAFIRCHKLKSGSTFVGIIHFLISHYNTESVCYCINCMNIFPLAIFLIYAELLNIGRVKITAVNPRKCWLGHALSKEFFRCQPQCNQHIIPIGKVVAIVGKCRSKT